MQDEVYYEKILHKKDHYNYAKAKGKKCEEYPDEIGYKYNDITTILYLVFIRYKYILACNLFALSCADLTFSYLSVHYCQTDSIKYFSKYGYFLNSIKVIHFYIFLICII
jgi:hypothetical protein